MAAAIYRQGASKADGPPSKPQARLQPRTWREEVEGKTWRDSHRDVTEKDESKRWSRWSGLAATTPWTAASGDEGAMKTGETGLPRRGSHHGGARLVWRPTDAANQ